MLDCNNDQSVCYDDFITFLSCSGSQQAKSTRMMSCLSEKEKNQKLTSWAELNMSSRAIFCQVLEDALKLAKKIKSLQDDYPIEISELRQKVGSYVDLEEGARSKFFNRFDESSWSRTRISLYEYDSIRQAFWDKGVRIGSYSGIDEFTIKLILR